MKYLILMLIGFVFTTNLFAQSKCKEKKQREGKPSEVVQSTVIAQSIANYGYANNNALSLISAADILIKNQPTELRPERIESDTECEPKANKKAKFANLDVKELLADARKMANSNVSLLALAEDVEKQIPAMTKAAVGGSKYTVDRVNANSSNYFYVKFYGGELAEVALQGDGETDLDLYIYDENGHLIDSDTDYDDTCYALWRPQWTGTFKIKIENRGHIYNKYILVTN